MAEALSPSKRELHQDHQEGTVKQFKADSPSALVTSESIQDKLEQVVSKLNEDRENDQIVIDGENKYFMFDYLFIDYIVQYI